jgi:2-dehydro-3-deoxyphosphogluconate aldolase/(4S)-4-hydroxy-2-oxoglutarate aldolase
MINDLLGANRIIATVTIDDLATAVPAAAALADGGIPIIEVMLRNETGLGAIAAIRSELPDLIVGAGTVLSAEMLTRAAAAGSAFAVSPGFDADVADHAKAIGIPYVPGAVTATEIQMCLRHGITTVKFFPATASGGAASIKALSAAFSVTGIEFIATGGIDDSNAIDYLSLPTVRAVGMSWLASSASIREQAWKSITARSKLMSEQVTRRTN